jgi:hypothetical protein
MELNQERIEAGIIAEVADKMIGAAELFERVKREITARIDKLWSEVAADRIRSEVELAIADGFERSYQRVNQFGQPEGEKTTIRAELNRLIAGYWDARVDRSGKATDSTYGTTTRAEWMMVQLVASDFQGDMKQHIVNLGGSLKDALRAELYGTVNKLLSDVFHVKTEGDKKVPDSGRAIIDPPTAPVR